MKEELSSLVPENELHVQAELSELNQEFERLEEIRKEG